MNDQDVLTVLSDKIDHIAESQHNLEVSFARLEAAMVPRHEVASEVEKRLLVSSYISDQTVLERRLTKLEQAPQSTRAWMNTIISGAGCLASIIIGGASITVSILVASHIIGR